MIGMWHRYCCRHRRCCCSHCSLLLLRAAHRLFLLVCTMGQVGMTQLSSAATLLQRATRNAENTRQLQNTPDILCDRSCGIINANQQHTHSTLGFGMLCPQRVASAQGI